MDTIIWLWEGWATVWGVLALSALIFSVLFSVSYFIWWRCTRVKCPECGGMKFGITTGNPKCIKCGWQEESFPWSKPHPNVKNKRAYHMVDWPKEKE